MIERIRTWLFLRRHYRACRAARDLARIGHTQRRQSVKETARRIREELGLEPDWRLG